MVCANRNDRLRWQWGRIHASIFSLLRTVAVTLIRLIIAFQAARFRAARDVNSPRSEFPFRGSSLSLSRVRETDTGAQPGKQQQGNNNNPRICCFVTHLFAQLMDRSVFRNVKGKFHERERESLVILRDSAGNKENVSTRLKRGRKGDIRDSIAIEIEKLQLTRAR